MGRNHKIGLEFWIRDIGLFRDPKFRLMRQEFGVLGPYVYECLLDIAYGDKGYYINYSGSGRDDTLWLLSEMTAGRYAPTVETLANVVDRLVACGLFSSDLYKRGFITSKRMQTGYFTATLGRSAVQINFDIWLLSEEEMREKNPSGKSFVLQSFISWRENNISGQETGISRQESTQRREQNSREQNSREEYSREQQSRERAAALAADLERLIGTEIDDNFRLDIARLMQAGMQEAVIMEAARQTGNKHPRKPAAYLRTILQGYERDGVLTAADLEATQGKEPPRQQPQDDGYLHPGSAAYDEEWARRVREHQKERRARRLAAEQGMNQEEDNA